MWSPKTACGSDAMTSLCQRASRFSGCVLAAGLAAAAAVWAAPGTNARWPEPTLPAGVRLFGIADHMTLNGVPMRLDGFVSNLTPPELIAQFRQSLGSPLVENRLGAQTILGRAEGRFYISVHIQPHAAGAQGTVAVSDLQAAHEARHLSARERESWLARLPAGTSLVSLARATDGPKRSLHLVFANRHGEQINARHLSDLLRDAGLREGVAQRMPAGGSDRTLFFSSFGQEAVATVSRASDGSTHVVLSLVSTGPGAER